MTRVHMRHVRTAGLCANGLLRYRAQGLDVRRLCREGLPVADAPPHLRGDPLVEAVIAVAEAEERAHAHPAR